ncbi:NADP-dependent malic enzyme 4 [Arabidopsis thaliana]|uniref:NADP-dependent malic enzyme 4, chloroplastic n=4 Tax=Arabidopsis TaxID=3701 RepID=MAOP4_ARATH|nr:NADP-malic enzyme 4 [Arabidopsis thaliana]Q9CA83.1 RecName: Full=NADP-dependent malic enzyme 4, chloroplastic; Short=AtNADP-ME4; Short=NADP-malic enzyme 4; Flags: Precursor [Arabidopsis thaliana]KAG7652492.1 Malic enzyme NAD-binding [Arabidopsis thaliana x Arabidopsis arenosa]KAG7660168.1 Malic enzyme NAD-binding [Arabidopsis suecica]AAG52235.1 putative malate oxidoreductase; 93001-96525 [Arabidopsis thaliana]AAL31209.1 At1g79750/F19K16_27 [Arabidopsis thaliana]AAM98328.1 At1g79750/F19K16_|eukprot:NP_178093.1 NADP-malic enzyme 4 [Arabidopsis thaliana]
MISLTPSLFLNKTVVPGCSTRLSLRQPRTIITPPASLRVFSSLGSNQDPTGSVLIETTATSSSSLETSAADIVPKSTVSGGVQDVYGEDAATEDMPITPWSLSVASGYTLLRDPHHNKGLAFSHRERDAHYLRGLLPPTVISQDLQVKKIMHTLRQYQVPLQKYMAMMDLQETNERLFYKLLIDHVEELLPVIYTPTVGEACQKYGSIFLRPQGLFISLKEKGKIHEVLRNWPEKNIQVIVVTDGERILGLGDLGCQGMGIPVGKLSLYTALGGVRPSACLPVTIDVGTNNEKLLNDEFYIGLRQRRATGEEYSELMHEFMTAVKQNYGEKVVIQFEDFANHNAFDLLAKYGTTHLVFNDDIQGTASVVLAGLIAALRFVGGSLSDHRFLFLGAGEAGTGIAELIALEISKKSHIPLEEARKNIWLVDSKGLIVSSRKESIQHFKKPWAHDHEPIRELVDAVKAIKPTVLIGTSGVGQTFTQDVVETMAKLNEKPIILSLSNPTSQSECTAEEAYTWSQGRAIFASGSPFAPVEYEGKTFVPGQANNAYIFPGFGLGLIMSGTIRVHDDMLLAASEALAEELMEEHYEKGMIYPPFRNIRKISARIAAKVAAKAYELGLATRLPQPKELEQCAESSMYSPSYRSYR